MPIALPGPDKVPDGPHRELLVRLHDLYRVAGMPATRIISRQAGSVSHETVSAVLHGRTLPAWAKLEAIVTVLCRMSAAPRDADSELAAFRELYRGSEPLALDRGHVFVSYSRRDVGYVDRLVDLLAKGGLPVWLDRHRLEVGDRWEHVVRDRVDDCTAMIVVMSPAAEASANVGNELHRARDRGKPLLPILLSGENWFALSTVNYFDARPDRLPDQRFLDRLRQLIRA
ncbi:toll/interleukin-1 receptor domain-containing protein [Paractinoplanes toevensis]|uniref:TIR domain-containing protein n=1 Tax=Paractinoplanes toevensis TaxID=571911 RepID=A0A919W9M2_9ACTN|nr:toll/interleukin-1 receptor domain-containing protein [Actinoplanes toevensis]GIM96172.1 hypothetical protein Ato02nite_079650 [Actinoplanes toevensis]